MRLIMMAIHSIVQKEINGLGGCKPKDRKRCGDECEISPGRLKGWCNIAEKCTLSEPVDCANNTKPATGEVSRSLCRLLIKMTAN